MPEGRLNTGAWLIPKIAFFETNALSRRSLRQADLPIPLSILNIAAAPNSRIDDSPGMNHRGQKQDDRRGKAYPGDWLGPSRLSLEPGPKDAISFNPNSELETTDFID